MSPQPPAVPRLSLAISLLALVVALGGTAVAAGLAANSVGTKQIKKGAVTPAKLSADARATESADVTAESAGMAPPYGVGESYGPPTDHSPAQADRGRGRGRRATTTNAGY